MPTTIKDVLNYELASTNETAGRRIDALVLEVTNLQARFKNGFVGDSGAMVARQAVEITEYLKKREYITDTLKNLEATEGRGVDGLEVVETDLQRIIAPYRESASPDADILAAAEVALKGVQDLKTAVTPIKATITVEKKRKGKAK